MNACDAFPDELGYLVDAIVNEDKISTFDKRPGDMSLEVSKEMRFGSESVK